MLCAISCRPVDWSECAWRIRGSKSRYQVYSSDQISARALLTPAVMERLMELERHTEGDPPRLVAEYGTLRVALSKGKTEDLFEPPSIANPAHSSDMLLAAFERHRLGAEARRRRARAYADGAGAALSST